VFFYRLLLLENLADGQRFSNNASCFLKMGRRFGFLKHGSLVIFDVLVILERLIVGQVTRWLCRFQLSKPP
jgi:hypothetical protein